MNHQWDKHKFLFIICTVLLLVLGSIVYFLVHSRTDGTPNEKQVASFTTSSLSASSDNQVNITGDYMANTGDKARLDRNGKQNGKQWTIGYQIPDGAVSGQFTTEWKTEGDALVATDKMKKSDRNTDFTITIRIFKYKAKKNHLITITMSDGNPNHEMAFANQKDFFESSKEGKKEPPNQQDLDIAAIMKGDYRTLAGYWKNEEGREITISSDGKTNRNENISPNLISTSKFPTLNIRWGNTGALIALFKIGFKNPYGDKSDTSRPRLLLGQNIGNEPADQYYYRQ